MYSVFHLSISKARKLRKYKERRLDGYHGGPNMGENIANVLDALEAEVDEEEDTTEEFVDPEAKTVTKVKRWVLLTDASPCVLFCIKGTHFVIRS